MRIPSVCLRVTLLALLTSVFSGVPTCTAGNPAIRRTAQGDDRRLLDIPPRGSEVKVLLVFPDQAGKLIEHLISEFITHASESDAPRNANASKPAERKFPAHTFLFAGSHLVEDGPGPRKYLSDESGNVISIVS